MKKLIAAILVVVMALGLLAGCGSNEPANQTDPVTKNPTPAGMLVLSAGAALSISYDSDGLVMVVDGIDDNGIVLTETYTEYLGKTCATVAKELIAACAEAKYLTAETKNIVIKQSVRSELPGSHFLETIETEVKAAAEAAKATAVITLIDESMLDDNGYINLDTAKALLCNELGVEKLDKYYGGETVNDGSYICTAEVNGKQTSHNIDAVTGLITEATEEELLGGPEDSEETISTEYEDEIPSEEVLEEDTDVEVPIESDNNDSAEDAT